MKMKTMKRSCCRTQIFLLVYFGIIYQLNIFRNYCNIEIQAWNTSYNMSESQEMSELNPSS